MILKNNRAPLLCCFQVLCIISQPSVNSNWSYSPETPNLGQNRQFFSHVTLKYNGWPSKTIGHLFYATSSFVQHFVAIAEFKLGLQSGNAQSGSNATIFIRPSLDGTYYGMALSVRPFVRPSVHPTVSTKKHRCKWQIFFKFCTQVCLGVPSINLLFVLSYLIKYAHNSIISDFSIFSIHRVIF